MGAERRHSNHNNLRPRRAFDPSRMAGGRFPGVLGECRRYRCDGSPVTGANCKRRRCSVTQRRTLVRSRACFNGLATRYCQGARLCSAPFSGGIYCRLASANHRKGRIKLAHRCGDPRGNFAVPSGDPRLPAGPFGLGPRDALLKDPIRRFTPVRQRVVRRAPHGVDLLCAG